MLKLVYGRSLDILKQKPFRLWGISLMFALLAALACALGILPIISLPLCVVLEFGMMSVYFAAYRGQEFSTEELFTGFKKGSFGRVAGGMLWMALWIFIWALIPIAGIVFAIIKAYSYRFVPYILMTDPEITATKALKKSMEMTKGYRGSMFGCDILLFGIIAGISIVLSLLSLIPYVGVVFIVINALVSIVVGVISPLMYGLLDAGYFQEVSSGHVDAAKAAEAQARAAAAEAARTQYQQYSQPQQPTAPVTPVAPVAPVAGAPLAFCPACGAKLGDGAFCPSCGQKVK